MRSPEMGFIVKKSSKIAYHLIQKDYPPLFAVGGKRAEAAFKILASEIGYTEEDGAQVIQLGPFVLYPAMVFLAVSPAVEPSVDLWYRLQSKTPKSAVDLIYEVADAERLKTGGPLIPPEMVVKVAYAVKTLLELNRVL